MIRKTLLLGAIFIVGCQHTHPATSPDSATRPLLTYGQIVAPEELEREGQILHHDRDVFQLDLDGDGRLETLVEHPLTRGNAGAEHSIYRELGGKYQYIGTVFFHRLALKVLLPTDTYPIRLRRYWRSSGSAGLVHTLGYQDGEFVILFTEVIQPGDGGTEEGRSRYAELFGA